MFKKFLDWLLGSQKDKRLELLRSITWYKHHDATVAVKTVLEGDHRDYCLCWYPCARFHPDNMDNQCPRAYELYQFCRLNNMVTPVWECPDFSLPEE